MRIKLHRLQSVLHLLGLLSTLLGLQVVQKSMAWRLRKRLLQLQVILRKAGSFLIPKMWYQFLQQCLRLDQLRRDIRRTNLQLGKIKQGHQHYPKLKRK